MKCPLCETSNIKILETILKNELIHLYKKMAGLHIGYLIKQDLSYCECQRCKLKFFNPLITGDEKFYNALQKFDWYYMDEKEEYRYAKKFIKSTDKVLEIGSGKGAFAKYIETREYIGLDFSENAKLLAAQNGIEIQNLSIEEYAVKNPESVDVVVSFQVLEHVSNPKLFIESSIGTLKQGGVMIIAVPSEDSFLKYVTNGILNMPPHHVTRWSDETLRFIADKYNLELTNIHHEKVQPIHLKWFITTIFHNVFGTNKMIEYSLFFKLKNRLFALIAKWLEKGFKEEMLPSGHTVIAVYKKV